MAYIDPNRLDPPATPEEVEAAEAFVDQATGDHFGRKTLTLELVGNGATRLWYYEGPVGTPYRAVSVTEVRVAGVLLPSDAWRARPLFLERVDGNPWPGGETITVAGEFGWESVPGPIQEATKRLILRDRSERYRKGAFRQESTRGYQVSLREQRSGRIEFTGDPDIDDVLNLYRNRRVRPRVV